MKPYSRSFAVASPATDIVWQLYSHNLNAAPKKRRQHSPLIHCPELSIVYDAQLLGASV